jgi:nucleoside-diphosphate-sugar epimerase
MSRTIACDVTKAKEELGYEPATDLEPGMRKSIEWAREHGGLTV